MKRRSLIKAGFVATAMTFGLTATAAMAETVTLRMATWLPPKHHHTAVALPAWIAAIDEASGGTLKIKIDPAPIAKPPGQYDIVRDGAADMSYHVVAYTPGPFEILRGVELPFLSPNAEIGSQAAYDWYDRNVGFDTEFKDVKIITMFVHGPGAVHTKTPVKTLEDLAGVKLRVGGGGVRMSEALGATPVAMPASKAYEAIQKGVADGAMFPFESIAGFRFGELVNYHLEIPGGLYTTPFAVMMNPAKYDSLSDEHKKVLADVGGVAGAKIIGAAWDDADAIGRQAAVDQGGVFHTLEGAELARWTDAIAFMDGSWIEKANAAGHDGAALLEDLKATIAKYSN
jgi:TRAP-type C4-dicarboxylate transport system substrate-binding protein